MDRIRIASPIRCESVEGSRRTHVLRHLGRTDKLDIHGSTSSDDDALRYVKIERQDADSGRFRISHDGK